MSSLRELHLPAAPRALGHVKQGSWRSRSFIWCLDGLRSPAAGPSHSSLFHDWVSAITRLLLVNGSPMKRAGSGAGQPGYCASGSQIPGSAPLDTTLPTLNNLITLKFMNFPDLRKNDKISFKAYRCKHFKSANLYGFCLTNLITLTIWKLSSKVGLSFLLHRSQWRSDFLCLALILNNRDSKVQIRLFPP